MVFHLGLLLAVLVCVPASERAYGDEPKEPPVVKDAQAWLYPGAKAGNPTYRQDFVRVDMVTADDPDTVLKKIKAVQVAAQGIKKSRTVVGTPLAKRETAVRFVRIATKDYSVTYIVTRGKDENETTVTLFYELPIE